MVLTLSKVKLVILLPADGLSNIMHVIYVNVFQIICFNYFCKRAEIAQSNRGSSVSATWLHNKVPLLIWHLATKKGCYGKSRTLGIFLMYYMIKCHILLYFMRHRLKTLVEILYFTAILRDVAVRQMVKTDWLTSDLSWKKS